MTIAIDYNLIIRGLETKLLRQEAAVTSTRQQLEVWKAQAGTKAGK